MLMSLVCNKEMSKIQITTWWTLMKVSGKMWLIVILKVTKKQCFFNPRKSILEKTTEGGQIDPHPPLAFLGSKRTECFNTFRHKSTTCWSSFLTQIYEIFVNLIMLLLLQWLFFFFAFYWRRSTFPSCFTLIEGPQLR